MGKIKAALFDLDGTLMDSEWYYTKFWNDIALEMLPDVPDLGLRAKGVSDKATVDKYFPDKEVQTEIYRRIALCDSLLPCTMYPGAMEFVRNLRSHGLKCAVVTSSNKSKMEVVYSRIPEFRDSFDLILTAEEFGRPKPAPDCYLKAAERLGVLPDECIAFEDSGFGLESAMSSGVFTFGMATGFTKEELAGKCHFPLDGFIGQDFSTICRFL